MTVTSLERVTAFFLLRTACVLLSCRRLPLGLAGSSKWGCTCSDIMNLPACWLSSKSKKAFWPSSAYLQGLEMTFRFSFVFESNMRWASSSNCWTPSPTTLPDLCPANSIEATPCERAPSRFWFEFLYPPRNSLSSISLKLKAFWTFASASLSYSAVPILHDGGSGVLICLVARESGTPSTILSRLPDVFWAWMLSYACVERVF